MIIDSRLSTVYGKIANFIHAAPLPHCRWCFVTCEDMDINTSSSIVAQPVRLKALVDHHVWQIREWFHGRTGAKSYGRQGSEFGLNFAEPSGWFKVPKIPIGIIGRMHQNIHGASLSLAVFHQRQFLGRLSSNLDGHTAHMLWMVMLKVELGLWHLQIACHAEELRLFCCSW